MAGLNLVAVLRLRDDFSSPMRRVQRQVERNERMMRNLSRSTDTATRSTERLSSGLRGVGRASSGLGSVSKTFVGIAATVGGAVSAVKLFQATVGEAMKYEMSAVTVDAMFNSKKIGKQYRDMVEKIAIDSPILESQELLASSRGFITKSKDLKNLEKMAKITEKLAAYDPIQGTSGAAFALNELMSGDAVSLQERFELSRTALKPIKDFFKSGDITKGLNEFDKYLEKIGISTKLINDMGNTASGKLAQVREQFALLFRRMGEPSLNVVSQFFDKIITKLESGELDRFANVGAKWIKSILTGLTNGVMSVYEWFNALTSSSEFQAKTTLQSKVAFIFDDIWARFMEWVKGGGQDSINKITKDVLELLATGLLASQQIIVDTAVVIGKAIGSAMASAASDAFAGWASQAMANSKIFNLPGMKQFKWAMDAGTKLRNAVKGNKAAGPAPYKAGTGLRYGQIPKRNGGVKYVPKDGAVFSLHRGEMVLPRGEADNYRKGANGNNPVNITLNYQGTGNTEKDAEKLLFTMARMIESEGLQMGRA